MSAQWKGLIKLSVQTDRNECTLNLFSICLINRVKLTIILVEVDDNLLSIMSYHYALKVRQDDNSISSLDLTSLKAGHEVII